MEGQSMSAQSKDDVNRADWEGMGQSRYTRQKKPMRERLLVAWEWLRLRVRHLVKRRSTP